MKIFSINLHHHMETDIYRKLEEICDLIANEKFDIIFLQEVGQFKMMPLIKNNIKQGNYLFIIEHILLEKYNIKYNSFIDIFKESYECSYEEGMAVLYNCDIKINSFYISKNKDKNNWETRKAIKVEIEDFEIYNVHFGWDTENELFIEQFENLNINLNKKCLLIGDFNCEYGSKNYIHVTNCKLMNAVEDIKPQLLDSYTWLNKSNDNEKEKIDHIFTNSISDIKNINYHFTDFSVSDHIGFEIEIN